MKEASQLLSDNSLLNVMERMPRSRRNRNNGGRANKPVTARAVRDMILARQEVKQNSSGFLAGIAFTVAGTIIPLDTIGQGDNINQRSGDVIRIRKLFLQISSFEPTANASSTWRLVVFSDSMSSGAPPVVTDVLDTANFNAPFNAINRQRNRFKIFHDKLHVMVGAQPNAEVTDKVELKLNHLRYYNDGTATNSNIGRGALFALVISSNATTSVYSRSFSIRYTDS